MLLFHRHFQRLTLSLMTKSISIFKNMATMLLFVRKKWKESCSQPNNMILVNESWGRNIYPDTQLLLNTYSTVAGSSDNLFNSLKPGDTYMRQ